jgi:hypothetical protein
LTSQYRARAQRFSSARHLPEILPEELQRRRDLALAIAKNPLLGAAKNGTGVPGLFHMADTGLTLQDARGAANIFLASLTPVERLSSTFPLEPYLLVPECTRAHLLRSILGHGSDYSRVPVILGGIDDCVRRAKQQDDPNQRAQQ